MITQELGQRMRGGIEGAIEPAVVLVSVCAPDFGGGFSLPRSQPDLPKTIDRLRSKTEGLAQGHGCLKSPPERTGIEAITPTAVQPCGQQRRLDLAVIAQAGVQVALNTTLLIPG